MTKTAEGAKIKKKIARKRKGRFLRKTAETDIKLELNIDGRGKYKIDSGVPFFNHMLEQFSKHSGFDMVLRAKGDTGVDLHHLIEDTGIILGGALKDLSGDKKGIKRFGFASVPMDDALVQSTVDFCGRAFFVCRYIDEDISQSGKDFFKPSARISGQASREILVDKFFYVYSSIFFDAVCKNALMNLHVNIQYGSNIHHMVEAIFKSTGRAVSDALKIVDDFGVPSTKGSI